MISLTNDKWERLQREREALQKKADKYDWIMKHMPNPVVDTINDELCMLEEDNVGESHGS